VKHIEPLRILKRCLVGLRKMVPTNLLHVWILLSIGAALPVVSFGIIQQLTPVIWFDDVPITSIREQQISSAIEDWWQRYKFSPLTVIVSDRPFETTVEQVGYRVDMVATVDKVRRARKSGFWRSRRDYKSRQVTPVAHLESAELDLAIAGWETNALVNRPSNAELAWEKGSIVAHPGQAGLVVDRQAASRLVLTHVSEMNRGSVKLPVMRIEPQPDASTLELLRQAAERLVKSPILLESTEPPIRIHFSRSDLGHLTKLVCDGGAAFKVVFDTDALEQLLHARHIRLDGPAKNATLELVHGNQFSVVPDSPGYHVSPAKLAARLLDTANNSASSGVIDVEIGEAAKVKATDVEHLGIRELIGSFTTRHPCCQPRVRNIHKIADILDGVVVLPGATFSVNETVGVRALANGFVLAPSIEDGEMVETIGGGVSQFATTFYNALLRAGLEIVERRAHTVWFDRYPMGHEATLSIPKPDLVFRNDTKAGVLIKTSYTEKSVTVSLYGDKEGRKVAFGVSPMQEVEPPPVERLPNADISPDKEHTKSSGRIGWSVVTWRTVTLANGEQRRDERKVTYKPQVRRVEVHPCRLKPDELGYTGEPCPKVEAENEGSEEL
jgi:vancomycin resistance protein YoaR